MTINDGTMIVVIIMTVEENIASVHWVLGLTRVVSEVTDSPMTIFDWNRNFIDNIGKANDHAIPTTYIDIEQNWRNISKPVVVV